MRSSIAATACYVSGGLLFASLFPVWPGLLYVLLRFVVGITAVVLVVKAEERRKQRWLLFWIFVAILFNPIVPLHLPYPLGALLSLTVGILFLLSPRILRF